MAAKGFTSFSLIGGTTIGCGVVWLPLGPTPQAVLILRNMLDGCEDPFVVRAAELLFRQQKVTLHENSLIAADDETIAGTGNAPLSPLVSMLGPPAAAEIDVMVEDNAETYWERSDAFDMALDLTAGRRGLAALGEVMTHWIKHMLAIDVEIEPLTELRDAPLSWYVGLSADATRIGDAIWNENETDSALQARLVGGLVFERWGSYDPVWWLSVFFGVASALINLPIVEKPVVRPALAPA